MHKATARGGNYAILTAPGSYNTCISSWQLSKRPQQRVPVAMPDPGVYARLH